MDHIIEIIRNASVTLPALEITVLLIVLSICLVFKFSKTGLLTAYAFAYKWGWTIFANDSQQSMLGYAVFGILVGTLTAIIMLRNSHTE